MATFLFQKRSHGREGERRRRRKNEMKSGKTERYVVRGKNNHLNSKAMEKRTQCKAKHKRREGDEQSNVE